MSVYLSVCQQDFVIACNHTDVVCKVSNWFFTKRNGSGMVYLTYCSVKESSYLIMLLNDLHEAAEFLHHMPQPLVLVAAVCRDCQKPS